METKSDKYQLCVLEGVQQGSRQVLRTAQAQSVGNSFDCNIYLHDDSDSVHQVEILPGRFSIGITLVSGDAVVDSTPMVVGQKYKLAPGIPVRLGESLFTVETLDDIPTLTNMADIHSDITHSESSTSSEHDFMLDDSADAVIADTRLINRLYRPVYLVLFIGFGLIGSVFVAWNSGPMQIESVPVAAIQTPTVDAQLASATAAQHIEDSVIDVFRTYGLKAEASSQAAGVVTVRTTSTDTEKITAAEVSANADVYGLKELIVDYDQPVPEKIELPKKVVSKAADQEIRMIVIGNPTYVMGDNQSRYFKGSKLPTGHRVADIQKGLVVVEKNGVTTELKL